MVYGRSEDCKEVWKEVKVTLEGDVRGVALYLLARQGSHLEDVWCMVEEGVNCKGMWIEVKVTLEGDVRGVSGVC